MDRNLLIVMFAVILVVGVVMLIIIGTSIKKSAKLNTAYFQDRMQSIERLLNGGVPATHMAILEADKLLDKAMKDKGTRGSTMADRLKRNKPLFSNVDAVWTAHKMRNRIAHEDNVNVSLNAAKKAVAIYRTALKDLGAI